MPEKLGARLREQRERRGMTLSAIADETKIAILLLEALERDDVSRWPGGLYRRAYIRSYARAVGLDPETIIREFMEQHPDPVTEADTLEAAALATETRRSASRGWGFLRAGFSLFQREKPTPAPETAGELADEPEIAEIAPVVPAVASPIIVTRGVEPSDVLEVRQIRLQIGADAPRARLEHIGLERDLLSVARLCTQLGCAQDQATVRSVLEEAGRLLGARGMIVWVWDAMRAMLCPAIAHGYPDQMLRHLASLAANTDSAIATAFRSAQAKVVERGRRSTGALVTPLMTPAGCIGVLAMEFRNGGEQRESTRAFAAIIGAQLSTLLPASLLTVEDAASA